MSLSFLQKVVLLGSAALGAATAALAQDSGPLIDLLVRKGVLNDQEAEELRTELVKEFTANTSAGKLNLGSHVTEFKLSGDLRLRHQVETQSPQGMGETRSDERTRERFRFRFNGDALLQKGWGAGFALETANAADSGNQTFENGNDDYSLYLARAYVSYRPNLNWFFVGGKQKNPFYTTDLVWDADINPQGVSENYTHFLGQKDTLEFRAGQIIMDDNRESTAGPGGRDAWLFSQQAVYTHWFGKDEIGNLVNNVILAPGFMFYNQSAVSGLTNETEFNGATNKLQVATFAGEVNFANIAGPGTQLKLYWDSAYNFQAESRVKRVYGLANADDDPFAWLLGVGYAYGQGKVQGDYSIKLDYRQSAIGALDPNLNDSDFGFGNLNQEGFKLAGSYNLTDFANLNVTYFYTYDIQGTLRSADSSSSVPPFTNGVAALDHSQILQVDLVVKF